MPTERWTTHELPGIRWDPADEPDEDGWDDDIRLLPPDLRGQKADIQARITDVQLTGSYL